MEGCSSSPMRLEGVGSMSRLDEKGRREESGEHTK